MAKRQHEPPTFDAYFTAALDLARLVRKALDQHGSVPREDMLKALKRFERLDYRAL